MLPALHGSPEESPATCANAGSEVGVAANGFATDGAATLLKSHKSDSDSKVNTSDIFS